MANQPSFGHLETPGIANDEVSARKVRPPVQTNGRIGRESASGYKKGRFVDLDQIGILGCQGCIELNPSGLSVHAARVGFGQRSFGGKRMQLKSIAQPRKGLIEF